MTKIQDTDYIKICAKIASRLSISLASARKRVDQIASKEGHHNLDERLSVAQRMLEELETCSDNNANHLDILLKHTEGNSNFILED